MLHQYRVYCSDQSKFALDLFVDLFNLLVNLIAYFVFSSISLQNNRESDQKDADEYKIETNRKLNEMARKINDGKKVHDKLTSEVRGEGYWS